MESENRFSEIVSPFGIRQDRQGTGLASRSPSLLGARLGLLHNGKPNAEVLLKAFGERLREHAGVASVRVFEKPHFGVPVDENLVHQMWETCDMVIAGVGD